MPENFQQAMRRTVSVTRTVRFGQGAWYTLPPQSMSVAVAIEVYPGMVPEIIEAACGGGVAFKVLPGERATIQLSA